MKARIRTAHGYLSFQPPAEENGAVTLQYRASPGAWEEIDVEAWDMEIIIPPSPEPGPDPGPGPQPPAYQWPGGITPSESAAYVGEIKAWLLSQGKDLSGPCGAWAIANTVAWGCQSLGTGIGILSKPGGNRCDHGSESYSVDIVAYKDYEHGGARIVDVLGDAGGENTPLWSEKGAEENVAMDRWCPAVNPALVGRGRARR